MKKTTHNHTQQNLKIRGSEEKASGQKTGRPDRTPTAINEVRWRRMAGKTKIGGKKRGGGP